MQKSKVGKLSKELELRLREETPLKPTLYKPPASTGLADTIGKRDTTVQFEMYKVYEKNREQLKQQRLTAEAVICPFKPTLYKVRFVCLLGALLLLLLLYFCCCCCIDCVLSSLTRFPSLPTELSYAFAPAV